MAAAQPPFQNSSKRPWPNGNVSKHQATVMARRVVPRIVTSMAMMPPPETTTGSCTTAGSTSRTTDHNNKNKNDCLSLPPSLVDSKDEEDKAASRSAAVAVTTTTTRPAAAATIVSIVVNGLTSNDERALALELDQLRLLLKHSTDVKRLEAQAEFFQAGGHLTVVRTMNHHCRGGMHGTISGTAGSSKLIQMAGMGVLINATTTTSSDNGNSSNGSVGKLDCRAAIAKVKGIDTIFAAMTAFPQDADIETRGLMALYNLTSNSFDNSKTLVTSTVNGGLPLIVQILSRFAPDMDVLLWACNVLKNLSRFEPLRPCMKRCKVATALAKVFETPNVNGRVASVAADAIKLLLSKY